MVIKQYILVDLWTFKKYKECYSKTSGKYVPFTYIKLLWIKAFCALDNHCGSDLTDGLTSTIADPLQVRENLFWNLYVDALRNHGLAPDAVNDWHSTRRTLMYEVVEEFYAGDAFWRLKEIQPFCIFLHHSASAHHPHLDLSPRESDHTA